MRFPARRRLVFMTAALALVAVPPNPPSSTPRRFLSLAGDVVMLNGDTVPSPHADERIVLPTLDNDADDASVERVAVEPSVTLTAESGGLSFEATVSPVVVAAGAPVSVRLEATDSTGDDVWFVHEIDATPFRRPSDCPPDRPSVPDHGAKPLKQRRNAIVAFPEAGDRVLTLHAWSGSCRAERSATVAVAVRVLPGRRRANGPVLPDVRAVQYDIAQPREIGVGVVSRDKDGYISELRFDWGDGMPPGILRWPLRECDPGERHWPFGERPASARHLYATAGQYDVVVTAVSVGCNGKERQESATRLTVHAPDDGGAKEQARLSRTMRPTRGG